MKAAGLGPTGVSLRAIEGRARRRIGAPAERCLSAAADAESWPDWLSGVESVDGSRGRVLVRARLLRIALAFEVAIDVERDRVTARRLPFDSGDRERFELVLTASADGAEACDASVEISARLEAPRLVPLPSVVGDQVAARVLTDLETRATP